MFQKNYAKKRTISLGVLEKCLYRIVGLHIVLDFVRSSLEPLHHHYTCYKYPMHYVLLEEVKVLVIWFAVRLAHRRHRRPEKCSKSQEPFSFLHVQAISNISIHMRRINHHCDALHAFT
jgi:hypothetical protein